MLFSIANLIHCLPMRREGGACHTHLLLAHQGPPVFGRLVFAHVLRSQTWLRCAVLFFQLCPVRDLAVFRLRGLCRAPFRSSSCGHPCQCTCSTREAFHSGFPVRYPAFHFHLSYAWSVSYRFSCSVWRRLMIASVCMYSPTAAATVLCSPIG